jgi:LemA protein
MNLSFLGVSMTSILAILIGIIIACLAYGILIYNNLVSLKNNVAKNWANIDVLLKQRNSEIPKLIDTCKEYMQFEQETLQKVVKAREATITATNTQNITALGSAETDLHNGLLKLFALAENYPDLKTNHSFMQLQGRISDLENAIADRREFYNESVNVNNIRIQGFPDLIVAKLLSFHRFDLLTFKKEELEDVEVNELFKK